MSSICILHRMSCIQELVKEGLVKCIGLSEVSAADIRRAHAVHPITAIEMEWSLFTRDCEVSKHYHLTASLTLAVLVC